MRTLGLALAVLLLVPACGGEARQELPPLVESPDRVVVDHILIGVKHPRLPKGLPVSEAGPLAADVREQLEAGGDWAELKERYSQDRPPNGRARGPYPMFDDLARVPGRQGEAPRSQMAKAFGDVAFGLRVGEIGVANYHPQDSPFGWHIIKRVQ